MELTNTTFRHVAKTFINLFIIVRYTILHKFAFLPEFAKIPGKRQNTTWAPQFKIEKICFSVITLIPFKNKDEQSENVQ